MRKSTANPYGLARPGWECRFRCWIQGTPGWERLTYQSKDGFYFELEGSSGEYNSVKYELNLSGDLKGKTSNGYMLYAERLMIYVKENNIKTDETVTFIGPFFKMKGKGLLIDLEKEIFKILKNVNSTYDKESLIIWNWNEASTWYLYLSF